MGGAGFSCDCGGPHSPSPRITNVEPDSPAYAAGLMVNDVIVAVGETEARGMSNQELTRAIATGVNAGCLVLKIARHRGLHADMITVVLVHDAADCQDKLRLERDMVMIRSRLRREIAGMSSCFEDVARRTRASGRTAPAVGDAVSADELISTWKVLYDGVCDMVLQCQHDISDDWQLDLTVGGTEISNSRAGGGRSSIWADGQIGSAEKRCKLVEEQISSLKQLFQVQWGLSQQVNVDIAQLRGELAAERRDVEKGRFQSSLLLEEIQSVRNDRDALQNQVQL